MKEALLIVDMSYDFVADDGGLTVGKPAQEIVPYIIEQANQMLQAGNPVVFTMDAHRPDDGHFRNWPKHNVAGTPGQELYGALKEWYTENWMNPNVQYVPKADYNAFFNTGLAQWLNNNQVATVHVTGVCTDICCFLTAAGANAEGFATVIHARGCATFTQNHKTFLEQMKLCFKSEILE